MVPDNSNNQHSRQKLKADLEYIQQVTGICPQHDILFDSVTVKEHLSIYCDFKGINLSEEAMEAKINKVISDVGLEPYVNT